MCRFQRQRWTQQLFTKHFRALYFRKKDSQKCQPASYCYRGCQQSMTGNKIFKKTQATREGVAWLSATEKRTTADHETIAVLCEQWAAVPIGASEINSHAHTQKHERLLLVLTPQIQRCAHLHQIRLAFSKAINSSTREEGDKCNELCCLLPDDPLNHAKKPQ